MSTSPQQQQQRRRLRRPYQDRAFAGVAAGLGQRFDVSAAWFRVGFILLALFGGIGFLLYGLGWILIPDEGTDESIAEGWVDGFDGSNSAMVIGVVLIGMAAVILVSSLHLISGKFVVAAVLLVLGVLLYRGDLTRSREPSDPAGPAPSTPCASATLPTNVAMDLRYMNTNTRIGELNLASTCGLLQNSPGWTPIHPLNSSCMQRPRHSPRPTGSFPQPSIMIAVAWR